MDDMTQLVVARFIEAADTESRLTRAGTRPRGYKSNWPEYVYEFADRVGWDEQRHKDHDEDRNRLSPPDAAAITRHDECMDWTIDYLPHEGMRKALWGMVISTVSGRPFTVWCKKAGMVRMTAYRRYHSSIEAISSKFLQECKIPSHPDWQRVLQLCPEFDSDFGMVGGTHGDAEASAA